jgi:hypothetical protein
MWFLRILGLLKLSEFFKMHGWLRKAGAAMPGIAAALLAIFVLIVASKILLVFDEIKSTSIRAVYGAIIALVTGSLAVFFYAHYVRKPRFAAGEPPPSRERLRDLYAKYGITPTRIAPAAAPSLRRWKGRGDGPAIVICGLTGGGKDRLARELIHWAEIGGSGMQGASIAELPPLPVWSWEHRDLIEMASAADLVLFAADQDLRDYEAAFIRSLTARGIAVIIAIDQPHWHAESDKTEVAVSIAAKFEAPLAGIVFVNSAPVPVMAVIVSADGREVREQRLRAPNIAALTALLPEAVK